MLSHPKLQLQKFSCVTRNVSGVVLMSNRNGLADSRFKAAMFNKMAGNGQKYFIKKPNSSNCHYHPANTSKIKDVQFIITWDNKKKQIITPEKMELGNVMVTISLFLSKILQLSLYLLIIYSHIHHSIMKYQIQNNNIFISTVSFIATTDLASY